WLTSAYAQWSPDRLHGVEQLSLGGESSVRGFKEQFILPYPCSNGPGNRLHLRVSCLRCCCLVMKR
ncbi:hypothetical protein DL979_25150, partial [Escherichia coli]|nr:hypothetical protein [Escherichia coli]